MKTTTKIILICSFMFLFNGSCSNDNVPILDVHNYNATINENPDFGELIGTIPSRINSDRPLDYTFEILFQSIDNAISIRNDGALSDEPCSLFVNDETVFDFETNPVITAIIRVSVVSYNLDFSLQIQDSKTITVTINVNDLLE